MEPLTAEEVLKLWERADRLGPADRALVLLARARRGFSAAELGEMTIGQSEIALLELRNATFGGELVALEKCPDCRAFVELSVDPAVLFAMARLPSVPPEVLLDVDGWQLRFRLPTLSDLKALENETDPTRAGLAVLERCAREVLAPVGGSVAVEEIPLALQVRVAAAMDEADPVAQLTLPIVCAHCGRAWDAELNVAAFFWREISAMARRLLGEVHELASRYGWDEGEILRLSAVRRHAYLEGRWL